MRIRPSNVLVTVMLALAGSASSAQEARSDGARLTLFSEAQFRGVQATVAGDTTTIAPLGAGTRVSSVRLEGANASWELCEEVNYGGRCVIVTRSEPDLTTGGWSGRVLSARRIYGVRDAAPGYSLSGIALFSEPGFQGRETKVAAAQRSLGGSPMDVRSVRVSGGTWEACEGAGFTGRCALVSGDVSDVRAVGFLERVGSLRLRVSLR
jgi:hypothetical protein